MRFTCKKCGSQLSAISPIFKCEVCGHVNKPISYKNAYRLLIKKYDALEKDFNKVYADLMHSRDANFNITLSFIITSLILLAAIIISVFIKAR